MSIRCAKCGASAWTCRGWLEKTKRGEWQCKPSCKGPTLATGKVVVAAIAGKREVR